MNKNTELGLTIILVALLLGILGDLLLRATPWGLNLTLWITLFISVLILLSRYRRVGLEGEGRWLLLPMLLFSFAFVWRDSLTLQFLDIMAIIICLALSTQYARDGMVRIASLTEYFIQMVMAAINSAFGFLLILVQDIEWKAIPKGKWMHHAISIFKGLLLATPLLIIFGLLFMAADAVFQGIVQKSLNISFEQLFLHGFIISFFTFVSAGLLRSALVGKRFTTSAPTQQVLSLGITEVATILFLVDMLFLGFVVVQIHYFFGGAAMVEQTTGLTYAEYARRGFFELVAVAALVLPMLLGLHWILRREEKLHEKIFTGLAGTQILLLFVIMLSAVQRMRLYQIEYGLTELRVYTMAFMFWLAVVFLLFGATVLRGRRREFAFGSLMSGFVAILLLHLANPDDLIVRVNTRQVLAGKSFDASYALSLSADSHPAIIDAMAVMNTSDKRRVAEFLSWKINGSNDLRTWNLARYRARKAIIQNSALFNSLKTPPATEVTLGGSDAKTY